MGSAYRLRKDVDAILNIATSAQEVGEGIGNKGLGFRSIGALTDDVRIFSRRGRSGSARFDGYCFRFANLEEIEALLQELGFGASTAHDIGRTVPRYLVPLPLTEQPDDVVSFARLGYASVIVAPLRSPEAIELAQRQVQELADLEVPLLLFLDRIADFRFDVETPENETHRRRLSRRQFDLCDVPSLAGCRMYEVRVGGDRRFLVVRLAVDKTRVLDAVQRSLSRAPQLKRWLAWKGQPTVSVAVGLSPGAVAAGRLYNFLPMGDQAIAPMFGHVDAPFFAEIDRRNADFDLPLNSTLLQAAAEACAHSALHIAEQETPKIPQHTVFDLIAWIGRHARKLDTALEGADISLEDAPLIPAIDVDGSRWSSLSEVSVFPAGSFSIMKAAEVARRTSARLVSVELDGHRRSRLKDMAERNCLCLEPSCWELSEWSERFAKSLVHRNAAPRTWSRFYEDLNRLFEAAGEKLDWLAGTAVMLDRSGKLRPAARHDAASGPGFFVRGEETRRKRTKGGVPFPPAKLSRRYRFLHDKIVLRGNTLDAFIGAGLMRKYDPVEALAGLGSTIGTKANDNRRREALTWAFGVCRTTDSGIRDALQRARLWVPTWRGWRPAQETGFSSSWTPVGLTLENYLVEASDVSPDCRRTRDSLLVDFAEWPTVPGGTKRQWVAFLKLLGVSDGLKPVAGTVQKSGEGWSWTNLVQRGDSRQSLDRDWCAEASLATFPNPYTSYTRRGDAWRLPGQIEHSDLPVTAKEAFQELVFRHLEAHGTEYLTFQVGRFKRPRRRDWNLQTLPTPLATFLRSRTWIVVRTHEEELGFRRADECWATRTRQRRPPRFTERVRNTVAGLVGGSEELANLVFGEALGLLDWQSPHTALERLQALAAVAPNLAMHDLREFRREYRRAWLDACEVDSALPRNLVLAVTRDARLERLGGDKKTTPTVIVTPSAQAFEARVLAAAGHAMLDVGEASAQKVAERLAATGQFKPRQIDGIGVRLLVDGQPFVPRMSDPLLTSLDMDWLPEIVLLGHEILAEGFERVVRHQAVEQRIRSIRLRRCQTITLVVDENDASGRDSMAFYSFYDSKLPTLILSARLPLTWPSLGNDLSRAISRLIDRRLRFVEPLLLRLARDQVSDRLDEPSDAAIASALGCDSRTLQEYRAALRMDLGHVLHLLMPVVAYFGDIALARRLDSDADGTDPAFDLRQWLRSWLPLREPAPEDLIAACGRSSDRAALRQELGLDYERFNHALLALGESPLSNEAELRSIYHAYRQQMAPLILERLRRCHAADFRHGRDLTTYVDRKTLAFLTFDPKWILTRATLDKETVDDHVIRLLDEVLGEDIDVDLPNSRGLLEKNRKTVRDFASGGASVVWAWCRRNQTPLQEPWRSEDPQSVVRHLENAGLLDFEPVEQARLPELCHRAIGWPKGMPLTLEPSLLGLDEATVKAEEVRREMERQRKVIEQRSIEFSGFRLDTADPSFADEFRQIAEKTIASDQRWLERSRRPRLTEFDEARKGGGSTRVSWTGGSGGPRKRPSKEMRSAMGLASEWLVFQFLRDRYGDALDETCWVSSNRARFFGGEGGDDAAGFDFCVRTPQAEWLYEVKSSLEDSCEFELTPNEMRVAASVTRRGRRRYGILYVPFVFSPDRWFILELPNPMGDETRNRFMQVGSGTVRFRFEPSTGGHAR